MMKRTTKRRVRVFLLVTAMIWALVSCASAPVPPVVTPEPVSELEFQTAQKAIDEAIAAGAETHAPHLLTQAQQAYSQAEAGGSKDPTTIRNLLSNATDKANSAKATTLLALLDLEAQKAIAEAEEAEAKTYSPDLLAQAQDARTQAKAKTFSDPDLSKTLLQRAIDRARAAKATALRVHLAQLDQQALKAITDAEAAGAKTYSPSLLAEAVDARAQARAKTEHAAATALFVVSIDRAQAALADAQAKGLRALLASLDKEAQVAIGEAEAADADQHSPALLQQARDSLTSARTKVNPEPEAAKELFQSSIAQARAARDGASGVRAKELVGQLDRAASEYRALQPDRWDPEGSASVMAQTDTARKTVQTNYAAGVPLVNQAMASLRSATAQLKARVASVQDLRNQAQKALDTAETADAYVWVPELVQAANDAFFEGTGAWKNYRLDAAEEAWSSALFQAKSAVAKAEGEVTRKKTEQLMLETMKRIEEASGRTVVDPQDNVVTPENWNGEEELEKLKTKPVSRTIPADGTVVVLGDKQRVTYLDEAKALWAQGVQAYEAGDFPLANESFYQAQKLIDSYLSLAAEKMYTVRLIPERRDSLWRIAEYDSIYGTPWEWPKIWKRNQKLIQNPDLIYPGWQLIIPPQ